MLFSLYKRRIQITFFPNNKFSDLSKLKAILHDKNSAPMWRFVSDGMETIWVTSTSSFCYHVFKSFFSYGH